jgi:hypothetical protein
VRGFDSTSLISIVSQTLLQWLLFLYSSDRDIADKLATGKDKNENERKGGHERSGHIDTVVSSIGVVQLR